MANRFFDKGIESFLNGGINWASDDIKLVLLDTTLYTVNSTTDQYLSDIAGGARVATSGNFASKTTTAGVADAADITLSSVTGAACAAIVIYKDTGTAGTSNLVCYLDTVAGLPVTPNGGNITVSWDNGSSKIFVI